MTATYENIATTTLGSSATEINFTSISGSFTDLIIVLRAIQTTGATSGTMQFNADTGNNYSNTFIEGTGSAASSNRNTNTAFSFLFYNNNAATDGLSVSIAHIMNYSNTTTHKTSVTRFGNSGTLVGAYVSTWRNTSAINSIKIIAGGQNFQSGSTFTLYGIKAE
jgi:hypothetical protein